MRSFGYSEALCEREVHIEPLDTRLEEAWAKYCAPFADHRATSLLSVDIDEAMALIAPLRMSKTAIDAFILRSERLHDTQHFGVFVGAAYQALPQTELVYDLHTPELAMFGAFLYGKHLIIDGTLGNNACSMMIGRLTVRNPVMNIIKNPARVIGWSMVGVVEAEDDSPRIGMRMRGQKNGKWNIAGSREQFLDDIMRPHPTYQAHIRAVNNYKMEEWSA